MHSEGCRGEIVARGSLLREIVAGSCSGRSSLAGDCCRRSSLAGACPGRSSLAISVSYDRRLLRRRDRGLRALRDPRRGRQDVEHRPLERAIGLAHGAFAERAALAATEADDLVAARLPPPRSGLGRHGLGQHVVRGRLDERVVALGPDLDHEAGVELQVATDPEGATLHHTIEARIAARVDLLRLPAAVEQDPAAGDVGRRIAAVARDHDAARAVGEIDLQIRLIQAVEQLIPDQVGGRLPDIAHPRLRRLLGRWRVAEAGRLGAAAGSQRACENTDESDPRPHRPSFLVRRYPGCNGASGRPLHMKCSGSRRGVEFAPPTGPAAPLPNRAGRAAARAARRQDAGPRRGSGPGRACPRDAKQRFTNPA